MILISQEALKHAWFNRPGEWLNTINGFTFRVDYEAYQSHPTKKVKLTVALVGGLSNDEAQSIIQSAHEAVGAPLDAAVQSGFDGTVITWDVKGPKAPRGAGKEQQPKKRKRTKKKGSELVPIYDSNEKGK